MSKIVLIINSSPCEGGNSETLAASFEKGVKVLRKLVTRSAVV